MSKDKQWMGGMGIVRAIAIGGSVAMTIMMFAPRDVVAANTRKAGASCSDNTQCQSGRCDAAPGKPSRCIPNDGTGNVGEYCTHNNQCSNKNCLQSQCKAPAPSGQACTTNASCISARCDTAAGNQQLCIPKDGTGQVSEYCSHDNQCSNKNCMSHHCRAPADPGQPCETARSCKSARCDKGAGNQKLCIPNDGTGQVGNYCTHNNQCSNRNCVDWKCTAAAALGQSCVTNASCASNRCDMAGSNARKCIPADNTGQVGNYCSHNNQCANRNCHFNKCEAPATLGKTCSSNIGCISKRCDAAPGNPQKCIPNDGTGKPGDYCSHNNQCRPGHPCNLQSGKRYGSCG